MKPLRRRMIRDIVVVLGDRVAVSLVVVVAGLTGAFSGSEGVETERSSAVSDQAMEKGWLVQSPMVGIVRNTYWPGLKRQGQVRWSVMRIALPGKVSMVAVVPP